MKKHAKMEIQRASTALTKWSIDFLGLRTLRVSQFSVLQGLLPILAQKLIFVCFGPIEAFLDEILGDWRLGLRILAQFLLFRCIIASFGQTLRIPHASQQVWARFLSFFYVSSPCTIFYNSQTRVRSFQRIRQAPN